MASTDLMGTRMTGQDASRSRRTSLTAAIVGNVLEFYDFTTFAFFATFIGREFFPTRDPLSSLLLTVATFGVGFLLRPIGGLVIGRYADRAGRKPALLLTISLMGLGMAIVALTPSYATIGLAAPLLVVLARLLQGFALGGEVGPASAVLIETAAPATRGLYGSWQIGSQGLATLIAGAIGVTLSAILPEPAMEAWGWRVPFLLGLLIVPAGLMLRSRMIETGASQPAARRVAVDGAQRRLIAISVAAIVSGTVSIYILNYMTTYAIATLHMPTGVALAATMVAGGASLLGSLGGGWLSDRIGRKPVMILPRIVLIAVAYPAFRLIAEHRDAASLLGMTALMGALNAPSSAVACVAIPECFPGRIRATAFALAYSLGVSIFGGTTQFVVTWLIGLTGDPLSPAWYLILGSVVGAAAMAALPESRHKALAE